jgi:hypothetical protein
LGGLVSRFSFVGEREKHNPNQTKQKMSIPPLTTKEMATDVEEFLDGIVDEMMTIDQHLAARINLRATQFAAVANAATTKNNPKCVALVKRTYELLVTNAAIFDIDSAEWEEIAAVSQEFLSVMS